MRRSEYQGSWTLLSETSSPRKVLRQLAEKRSLPAKQKARVSIQAMQECLDLSHTPMVMLDKQGSAVLCNASFRAFALQDRSLTLSRSPEGRVRDSRREILNSGDCCPEARAWLDSSAVNWPKFRVALQRIRIGREEVTVYSILTTEPEVGTSFEKEFLHGVMNAVSSVQILMDLAEEAPSDEACRECLSLAQRSMQQLRLKMAHEAALLSYAGLPVLVRDLFEMFVSYYQQLPRANEYRIEIQDDVTESRLRVADLLGVRIVDRMLDTAVSATTNGGLLKLSSRRIGTDVELRIQCPEEIPPHTRKKIFGTSLLEMAPRGGGGSMRMYTRQAGKRVSIHFDKTNGTTLAIRCFAAPNPPVLRRRVQSVS